MPVLRTVKLVIGFQGTRYEGWQSQRRGAINRAPTLQDIFEKILKRLFKKKTNLVSSSRTDSGVHAEGLAAHFRTKSALPDKRLKAALNYYLPRDILVHSAKTVSGDFHARFDAHSKLYRYDIWNSSTRPLFQAPFVLWFPERLDAAGMKKAARSLVGKHDFSAFKDRGDDERKSFVRTVKRLRVMRVETPRAASLLRIEIEADGFLRHMVRIIVGTLIEVGRKKIPPEKAAGILLSKDRTQAGPTAKACGLTLVRVKY